MQKKFITPLIITIIMIVVFFGVGFFYFTVLRYMDIPRILLYGIAAGTIAIIGGMIAVFIQRIKEIKEENEDDLRKY